MTIASTANRKQYSGNDAATVFSFPYKFNADADIVVILTVDATEIDTPQIITTHYTLTGADGESGGNVTMLTAPATGETLTIYREVDLTQETDLSNQGAYFLESLEDALDYLTMAIQQIDEEISRSIKTSIVTGVSGVTTDTIEAYIDTEVLEQVDATMETNTHEETASASQQTVTVTGFALAAALDNIEVYIDGVKQAKSTLTRTSDTVITLGGALTGGEKIELTSAKFYATAVTDAAASATAAAASAAAAAGAVAGVLAGTLVTGTLEDAVNAVSSQTTLIIGGTKTITDNFTIPSYIELKFVGGGLLSINSGKTLTINGTIKAGPYQIFTGSGSVVFGNLVYTAFPEWWGVDGVADEVQINAAITALTTGTVQLTQAAYATAATISIASGITLSGMAVELTIITYSGNGSAVTATTVTGWSLTDFKLQCTHDNAHGIDIGDSIKHATLRRLMINNDDGAAQSAGAGIYLRGTANWSGGLLIENVRVTSFKWGIYSAGGSWTTITGIDNWFVGQAGISGGAGIHFNTNANGVGSEFMGGTIESFETGVKVSSAANLISLNVSCDFENNTANYDVGEYWNGRIQCNNAGWFIEKGTNATTNVWYQTKQQSGVLDVESYFDQYHTIMGAGYRYWGAFTGGQNKSRVHSELVHPAGGFRIAPSSSHAVGSDPEQYYMYIRDRKLTWGTAAPTGGGKDSFWAEGDIIFNADVTPGGALGWICSHSGTFGTATDSTGDTNGSTAVITGMADTSDFEIGNWVDVSAGFPTTGPYKIIDKTATSITLDTNSNSVQSNITVDTSNPTFIEFGNANLQGSTTWDPGSLADSAGETSSGITVTGAALGDFVMVSAPYDLQDCTATAYVQAANTVEIRLQNESGGAVDLASGTWRVKVIKM